MPGDDSQKMGEAFLESELMDETSGYLARGRRFENLSTGELGDGWVRAFTDWRANGADHQVMDDLAAELRLRKLDMPYERVAKELDDMRDQIRSMGPNNPGARARIAKFLGSLDNPNG
jgi:hypothetical protein